MRRLFALSRTCVLFALYRISSTCRRLFNHYQDCTNMRYRFQKQQTSGYSAAVYRQEGSTRQVQENLRERDYKYSGFTLWLTIFAFFIGLWMVTSHEQNSFPPPRSLRDTPDDEFCEERARMYLKSITDIGPRTVGSFENERVTVVTIARMLRLIIANKKSCHSVQYEVMTVSGGSFSLDFIAQFSSVYSSVRNILAKIGPTKEFSRRSLLVNCHYDTVVDSPGGSDDAVSCALMLETLRALSQRETALTHPIIFNFNGAEENILQASHGFITQHPWAKTIQAFVNLEGAGAGGKELVFQIGPGDPWLVDAYAKSVKYPHATVIANELFETGVIPGDTDFRIYRDYGHVSGIDIAYVANGYVYHTKYDTPEFIPPGCIQRGGENLLGLVSFIGSSTNLSDGTQPGRLDKMVYFDVFGLFLVSYSFTLAKVASTGVILLVLGRTLSKISKLSYGMSSSGSCKHLCLAMLSHWSSWLAAILTNVTIAVVLTTIGRSLSWYTNCWLLIGLYICPSILCIILLHDNFFRTLMSVSDWRVSEDLMFDACQLVLCCLLGVTTGAGLTSGYVFFVMVLFPLLGRWAMTRMASRRYIAERPWHFLAAHLAGQFVPCIVLNSPIYTAFQMFIPLLGRTGSEVVPDVPISILAASAVVLLMSYQVGFIYACKDCRLVKSALTSLFGVSIMIAVFTSQGFPYSGNPNSPSPQRFVINHIYRTFSNATGSSTDSGILIIPFDYNGISKLPSDITGLSEAAPALCEDAPYCGWPYYFPVINIFKQMVYIPAPAPVLFPTLSVRSRAEIINKHTQLLHLTVAGPNHINLFVRPVEGVMLTNWSTEGAGEPKPCTLPAEARITRPTYFMFFSYGQLPKEPWSFWLKFMLPDGYNQRKIVEIAFSSHYLDGEFRADKYAKSFLSKFPNWTVPVLWSAAYEVMEF